MSGDCVNFLKGGFMKRYFLIAILFADLAHAGVMGLLVHDEQTFSVTGKMMHVCTYRVFQTLQTVNMTERCPQTMQFD
jgi:hypothetical protein